MSTTSTATRSKEEHRTSTTSITTLSGPSKTNQNNPVIDTLNFEGTLEKQGRLQTWSWKKYHFILDDDQLCYYKIKEEKTTSKRASGTGTLTKQLPGRSVSLSSRGLIDLSQTQSVKICNSCNRGFPIEIVTSNRVHILSAENTWSRDQWLKVLQKAMQIKKKRSSILKSWASCHSISDNEEEGLEMQKNNNEPDLEDETFLEENVLYDTSPMMKRESIKTPLRRISQNQHKRTSGQTPRDSHDIAPYAEFKGPRARCSVPAKIDKSVKDDDLKLKEEASDRDSGIYAEVYAEKKERNKTIMKSLKNQALVDPYSEVEVSEADSSKQYSEVDGSKPYSEIDGSKQYSEVDGSKQYSEVDGSKQYSEVDGSKKCSVIYDDARDDNIDADEEEEEGQYAEIDINPRTVIATENEDEDEDQLYDDIGVPETETETPLNFDFSPIPPLPHPRIELTWNSTFDQIKTFIANNRGPTELFPTPSISERGGKAIKKLQEYLDQLDKEQQK